MKEQLELTFDRANLRFLQPAASRRKRTSRSRWWFSQMRQAVDRAFDRRPPPVGRPEQIYLRLPSSHASRRLVRQSKC